MYSTYISRTFVIITLPLTLRSCKIVQLTTKAHMDVGISNRGIRSKYTPHTDRVQITQGTKCIRTYFRRTTKRLHRYRSDKTSDITIQMILLFINTVDFRNQEVFETALLTYKVLF